MNNLQNFEEHSSHDPKEIKYGMIAVPKVIGNIGVEDVLHFVGFWEKPGESDYKAIREELENDLEFGLTDIEFDLIEAPSEFVDLYRKNIINSTE
jgi:hypothetical protein